jgi:hypothetical protein
MTGEGMIPTSRERLPITMPALFLCFPDFSDQVGQLDRKKLYVLADASRAKGSVAFILA